MRHLKYALALLLTFALAVSALFLLASHDAGDG